MENKTEPTTSTGIITTQCQCKECPNCSNDQGAWYGEDITCYICGAYFEPTYHCFEDPDADKDYVKEFIFDVWREARTSGSLEPEDMPFYITANGMGWTSTSATSDKLETWEDAFKCLTLNGDYRLEFTYKAAEKSLTVSRYSHDEPTGAFFEFYAWDIDAIEAQTSEKLTPILDLWRLSSNFGYGSAANPLTAFMDIIGYSKDYYGDNVHPWDNLDGAGFMEGGYLGAALVCWSDRPRDTEELLNELHLYAN
jgi:hypothetical protein